MEYNTLNVNRYNHFTEIRLNRPEVRNAMNDEMLDELIYLFDELGRCVSTNVVLLRGEGSVFSAGADLNWMSKAVALTKKENIAESQKLFRCFDAFSRIPATTVAWLNGPALGGALGIAAAADFVWLASDAFIQFSEVKLGLVPATVAPFVVNRVGVVKAKQWMTTARKIHPQELVQANFADEIVLVDQLPEKLDELIVGIQKNDKMAIGKTKNMLADLSQNKLSGTLEQFTASIIAEARASDSAQERMRQFLSSKSLLS